MSVSELSTVDMAQVLTYAYELGDMINESTLVSDYLYWQERVNSNPEIQEWVRRLEDKKELFAETQRFGRFHPNYHSAKDEVKAVEDKLDTFEEVIRFKEAEQQLDSLLHQMSETIAFSVSSTIKVPSNNPSRKRGCGGGGSCGCG